MGKTAILAIFAFGMLATYYTVGTQKGLAVTEEQLAQHQFEVLSRNAALAGYERARQALAEDFAGAPSAFSGTYERSAYSVTITRSGSVAEVTSTGLTADANGDPVEFNVVSSIEREIIYTIADEAPPFMRYALLAENDLNLDGNILTDLYVQGDVENTLNANMHTNHNLNINGSSVEVRGFGTFVGTGTANPSSALYDSFDPYYNPTNEPTAAQASPVEIPPFDANAFANKVNVDSTTGSVTLAGTYNLGGTREDPFIWRISGDLNVSGNSSISGYVMFIVEGNADLSKNMVAGESGYDGGDESSTALYVGGNVTMSGNPRVYGQIVAEGSIAFASGSPRVYGSVTTRGSATLSGAPKIYYRRASPALSTVYQDPEIRIKMIAYSEW